MIRFLIAILFLMAAGGLYWGIQLMNAGATDRAALVLGVTLIVPSVTYLGCSTFCAGCACFRGLFGRKAKSALD
jgi:hypothetical protein